MKYIKHIIDFNNWDKYEDEFNIGDIVLPKNKYVLYVSKDVNDCIYVTKNDNSNTYNTYLQDDYYTIQKICINKDISYIKLHGH